MINEGEKALDFKLPDQNGQMHQLSDYLGKWVVVYFYPQDDTPGCTTEAKRFTERQQDFLKKGIQILGISKDTVESHKKFADKYHLNFPILSDSDKQVIGEYGVWNPMGYTSRTTFLIGPEGVIKKEYKHVDPAKHAEEIISDYESLARM